MEPVEGQEEVLTGGKMWMRDFFIHDGRLLESYGDYLLASFSPFSSPGVHLILDAPAESMSAAYFSQMSEQLAGRVFAAQRGKATRHRGREPTAAQGLSRQRVAGR